MAPKAKKYIMDEDDVLPHADQIRERYVHINDKVPREDKDFEGDAITKGVECDSNTYIADFMPKVGKVRDFPLSTLTT